MLQRYKLRLGDGTVVGVDHEGLHTWAVDGNAMVQAATSHRWYPLKAFLAAERAAAKRAAQQKASGPGAPVGPPKPLPLVYPGPREPKAPPQAAPAPSEPPPFASSSEIQVLAEAPAGPPETLTAQTISAPDMALPVAPITEPSFEPVEEWADLQALAEDPAAPVLNAEPAVPQALADAADEPILEAELAAALDGDPEQEWISDDDLTALPTPLEDRDEAGRGAALFSGDAVEPVFIDAPLDVEVLADELTVSGRESDAQLQTWDEDVGLIGPTPFEGDVSARPDAPLAPPPLEARPASPRPSLQVLADDLTTKGPGAVAQAWKPDDELPIIPLKPLDHEKPAGPGRGTYEEHRDQVEQAPPRSDLDETLLRWFARGVSAYDALLTGWINRLARRPEAISAVDPTAASTADSWESILEGASSPVGVPPNVSALAVPIENDPLPDLPPDPSDDQPLPPIVARAADLPSHEPLKAPPPLRNLPVLRLADIPEPAEEGDVYETERRLRAAWRWTKRIVVTSGLLVGGLVAVLRFETWVPRAEQFGRAVFTEIDRIRQARHDAEALQAATEQLPHLSPETIRLLMAHSPAGILDPPEMFRVASDAADRGASVLTPAEVQQLKELRGELLKTLRPSERERIREYDAARVRRLVFPFEGRDVLGLVGRGAYALPQESRERLQELFAKAIAAGLLVSPEAPPGP
jgi:hypothetical protein